MSQKKNPWYLDHHFGREIPKWDRLEPLRNLTARVSIFSAAVSYRRNGNSFSVWTDMKMNRPSMEKQGAESQLGRRPDLCMWLAWASSGSWGWDICDQCWASPSPVISLSYSYWGETGLSGEYFTSLYHKHLKQVSCVTSSWCLLFSSECKGSQEELSQMKWGHKKLTEINPAPGVSMAPRLC